MQNPSLTQVPREQNAPVIPIQHESSILVWLENSGRMIAREVQDYDYSDNEEEIAELMGADDGSFDTDDDDDLPVDED